MKQVRTHLLLIVIFCTSLKSIAQLDVDFSSDDQVVCPGVPVLFSDLSVIPLGSTPIFSWNFPGGFASSLTVANPTVYYYTAGTYSVTLTVTVAGIGSLTEIKSGYITVVVPGEASFTSSFPNICNQLQVSFTNTSVAGTLPISSYLWDFGDGTFSTLPNPVKTYSSAGTYTVILFTSDGNNCSDNYTQTITTTAPLSSVISTTGPTSSCGPAITPTISAATSGGFPPYTYTWDYGNGTTSTLASSPVTYSECGQSDITYTVTDNIGCSVTQTYNDYINISCPSAAFTELPNPVCFGSPVSFTNLSAPGATSYYWQFSYPGTGFTSSLENPSFTYTSAGTKTVKLTVTYPGGCTATYFDTIEVLPKPTVMGITATDTTGCDVPFTTTLSVTGVSGTAPFTYSWLVGGTTYTGASPTITLTEAINYSVTLTVTDANGCSTTQFYNAFIKIKKASAVITATPLAGCAPLSVTFSNLSVSTLIPLSYFVWDFDDGTVDTTYSLDDITHVFTEHGNYHVEMTLYTTEGCPKVTSVNIEAGDSVAYFVFDEDTDPACNPVNLNNQSAGSDYTIIDWGDSTTTVPDTPNADTLHFFNSLDTTVYIVTLTAIDNGCVSNWIDSISVLPVPYAADYTWDCTDPSIITISLDTSSLPSTYCWDFGTGDTLCNMSTVTWDFDSAGTYFVSITTSDSVFLGACDDARVLTINVPSFTASAILTDTIGCGDMTVHFASTSVIENITTPVTYTWQIGPGLLTGTSFTGVSPDSTFSYPFTVPDIYPVSLTIENGGCTNAFTDTVTLGNTIALFNVDSIVGCSPRTIYFSNASSVPDSTGVLFNIASYEWNFGDTSYCPIYYGPNPPPCTLPNGIYTVTLTVTDNYGCSDIFAETLNLNPLGIASFTPDSLSCSVSDPLYFENTSTGYFTDAFWDFGDDSTSTEIDGEHIYASSGEYNVTLIVSDSLGCSDSVTQIVNAAVDNLDASFSVNYLSTSSCPPIPVQLINTSTGNIGSILWKIERETGIYEFTDDTIILSYTEPGEYDVTLYVTSVNGCIDSVAMNNILHIPGPTGSMITDPVISCSPNDINFNLIDIESDLAYIDFGDGDTTLVTSDVSHTYTNEGTYCPYLILIDSTGCSFEATCTESITLYNTHIAGFNLSDSLICLGNAVGIANTTISSPLNPVDNYTIDFGDGSPVISSPTFTSLSHLYATTGTYTISLFTTSAVGCNDTINRTVEVNTSPTGTYTFSPESGCFNLDVSFDLTSLVAEEIIIDYGDGITDTTSGTSGIVTHTYTTGGVFYPAITLSNGGECFYTISSTDSISVFYPANASVYLPDTISCSGEDILLVNTSWDTTLNPITNYTIDFGDGSPLFSAPSFDSIIHSYPTDGAFDIYMYTTTGASCYDTTQATAYADEMPAATFSYTPLEGCFDLNVLFTADINADSAYLDFGNGSGAIVTGDTAYTYTTPGIYLPVLYLYNANGCEEVITGTAPVEIYYPPVADFYLNDSSLCLGNNVVIYNTSWDTTDAPIINYGINFGDGSPLFTGILTDSITHNYSSAGSYNISMTVMNDKGCSSSHVIPVQILESPTSTFSYSPDTGCFALDVLFTADINADSAYLDFDDGTGSVITGDINHTYTDAGIFNPVLYLYNANTCSLTIAGSDSIQTYSPPVAAFSLDDTTICSSENIVLHNLTSYAVDAPVENYTIDYGDGSPLFIVASLDSITHNYATAGTYTITLNATNTIGCSSTVMVDAVVSESPSSTFDYSPDTGCFELEVFFNAAINADSATLYFGDGNNAIITGDTSYIYTLPGNYSPVLYLNNANGCSLTVTDTSQIEVYNPPVSAFSLKDSTVCSGENVVLYNLSWDTIDAPITSYTINYGDGSPLFTGMLNDSIEYFYSLPGTYTITIDVMNSAGCSSSHSVNVEILPLPSATLDIFPTTGCGSLTADFTITSAFTDSVFLNTGESVIYVNSSPVSYTYNTPGIFYPSLLLTNNYGCTQNINAPDSIVVSYSPVAAMILSDSMPFCTGQQIYIIGLSVDTVTNLSINPIDNITLDVNGTSLYSGALFDSIAYSFSAPGYYAVTMIASNTLGCIDSSIINFEVHETPVALAGYDTTICPGLMLTLDGTSSSGGYYYNWLPAALFADNTIATPSAAFDINTDVTLQYSNDFCSDIDTVKVNVLDELQLQAGPDTAICYGNSVQLFSNYNSYGGDVSFIWLQGDWLSSTLISNPVATPQNSITYTVSATCGDLVQYDDVSIIVNPLPVVDIADTATMIINNPIELNATATGGTGYIIYQWSPINYLSCPTCAITMADPPASQQYFINAVDENNCSAMDSIYLRVGWECAGEGIEVSNIITPNNDGLNDKFEFRSDAVKQLDYFRIYDRWGAVIFESEDKLISWDGSWNGKLCDQGVYVYTIKGICYDDMPFVKSGNITLIR